jgi:hypothetical protein
MPAKDDFDPDHSLPLFLSERREQQEIGNAVVTSSRVFKAGALIAIATVGGIAALLLEDPVALIASVRASLTGHSELQPGPDQSAPAIAIQSAAADAAALTPSAADAQASPPAAKDAPTQTEIAEAEPAAHDQADNSEASYDALFRQFQAWAAEQDAQAHVKPAQPAQDASAQVEQDAPAQAAENAGAVQKRRQARAAHNARAETRAQNLRRTVDRAHNARIERPPAQAQRRPMQDARAQEQPAQDAQAPSFLPIFGQRN